MGSTAKTLLDKLFLRLGQQETGIAPDLSLLTDDRKIILQSLQQAQYDVIDRIDFPSVITQSVVTITEGQIEYTLPTDIYERELKYAYVMDEKNKNRGYIEVVDFQSKRKRDNAVGQDLSIMTFGGYYRFTKTATSTNPCLSPKTIVNADSLAGQKVINVADESDFSAAGSIVIGRGTPREEVKIIDTTATGTITVTENLVHNHTALTADAVNGAYDVILVYKKTPTVLDEYDDESEVPTQFDDLLMLSALSKYYRDTSQFNMAASYMQEFEKEVSRARKKLNTGVRAKLYHYTSYKPYTGGW